MAFDVLEEEGWATSRHFADPVCDLSDFEDWVDFGTDLFQLTGAVERRDPVA
jgi:hypothetical protein